MEFKAHQSFPVIDRTFFNSVKRDINRLAESYGFEESKRGKIDIIVSELTSNLVKHTTQGGEILVKPIGHNKITGIEILCIDNGPGMTDPQRMMEDGVSTAGSKGEGLGAVKRLSDDFDLYSLYGNGTVILSRLYLSDKEKKEKENKDSFDISAVMVPKPGETDCGDGWTFISGKDQHAIIALDGLGHGPDAHQAAMEGIEAFKEHSQEDPSSIIKHIHQAIKKTRGAVGALGILNNKNSQFSFCGIGNIGGKIFSMEGVKNLISYNGILGHNVPTIIHNHPFPWNISSLLIMHSDGLKSRWDISKYPDLKKHDTSVIAATLYKDNNRKTDDVLIIVGRSKR